MAAVVITVLNAYSGFALVAEGTCYFHPQKCSFIELILGFMLDNPLLTTVGSLIGVSGSILSYIMVRVHTACSRATMCTDDKQCVAMNRSLTNVLFGGAAPVATPSDYKMEGQITQTSSEDVVEALANADSVILASPLVSQPPFPLTCRRRVSSGCWVRYGCGKGPIRDIGNHFPVAGKGRERTLRDSSRRRTYAGPMQRLTRRSIGALRQ